jgi:hypothetical protein
MKQLGLAPDRRTRPIYALDGAAQTTRLWYDVPMPKLLDRPAQKFVLGRARFAKISAAEGIHLTRDMQRDLEDFDKQGLSAEERRKRIVQKYGKRG